MSSMQSMLGCEEWTSDSELSAESNRAHSSPPPLCSFRWTPSTSPCPLCPSPSPSFPPPPSGRSRTWQSSTPSSRSTLTSTDTRSLRQGGDAEFSVTKSRNLGNLWPKQPCFGKDGSSMFSLLDSVGIDQTNGTSIKTARIVLWVLRFSQFPNYFGKYRSHKFCISGSGFALRGRLCQRNEWSLLYYSREARAENRPSSPSLRTNPLLPPDFDLLSKLTLEMAAARPAGSALSLERLLNVQRWRRHVQSFGHTNRNQARNPLNFTHAGVLKDDNLVEIGIR